MSGSSENAGAPRAVKGPNGLIELRQMNGLQGWHSGYLTPKQALELADTLRALAHADTAQAPATAK